MASGIFALFDDIAVLARAAASTIDDVVVGATKASAKAAGVVIDDAAVTPQYLHGLSPSRELPIVWRITKGSLINKTLVVAAIMLLSVWAPWVFPWMLMIGGTYLAFEGSEKVWHWVQLLRGISHEPDAKEIVERSAVDEKQVVSNAVRTDLVLSAEIMLISLANIETDSWGMRLAMLVVIAILMTVAVYGVVAVLVKLDDVGLWMLRRPPRWVKVIGMWLVKAMPWVFRMLTIVGTIAMLWVGGHILLLNLAEVGVPVLYEFVHSVTELVSGPGIIVWIVDSGLSAIFGLVWGSFVLGVIQLVSHIFTAKASEPVEAVKE